VTIPRDAGRRRNGLVVHRSRTLRPDQITLRLSIPVTAPSRTLADLRRILPQPQYAAALREAEFLGLAIAKSLHPDATRSELEARFLRLCRRHRLPRPEVNVRIEGLVVDFLWPAQHLVVELDGWASHRVRSAFEADRERDRRLKLLGYDVVRFTWRQLAEPESAAATVRRLLRDQ